MRLYFLLALAVFTWNVVPTASAYAKTYEPDYVGETEIYRAKFEDTLVHLARDNNLGFVEVRAANPKLDPWIPGKNAKIILPKRHLLPDAPRKGIVINLSDMRLYHYPKDGGAPRSYSIGIGREGLNTPLGQTTIVRKKEGPRWTPTPRMRKEDPELPAFVPPGPENPLGTHALYLGWPAYAIHGTNKPYGIGRRVSSGCIRLYPESIKKLYPRVARGTQVTVVDQSVKVGWIEDKMYIEVHPTQDQSIKIEEDGVLNAYEITKEDLKRISEKAGDYADRIDWSKVREAVKEHKGYPVAVLDKRYKVGKWAEDNLDALIEETGAQADDIKKVDDGDEASKKMADVKAEESSKNRSPAPSLRLNN